MPSARMRFQECDTVGITRPIVKHNFLVKDVRDLAATIKKAFYIAAHRPSGPVVVDIPKDVSRNACKYELPESRIAALVQPRQQGAFGPDPQGGAAAACRRSARISIPAAACMLADAGA